MNRQEFQTAKVGDRVKAKPGTFLDAIGTIVETGFGTQDLQVEGRLHRRKGVRFLAVRLPSGNEVVTWDSDDKHRSEWDLFEEGNGIESCRVCGGIEAGEDGQCVNPECKEDA